MTPGASTVRLERWYPAPREAVFRAFTEPALLERWFAPRDGMPTSASVDLRVGGAYRIAMGSRTASGTYLEIVRPERLVFTWVWEEEAFPADTVVRIELSPRDDGTLLRLVHDRLPSEVSCMGFEAGWTANLGRLERLLAEDVRHSPASRTKAPLQSPHRRQAPTPPRSPRGDERS